MSGELIRQEKRTMTQSTKAKLDCRKPRRLLLTRKTTTNNGGDTQMSRTAFVALDIICCALLTIFPALSIQETSRSSVLEFYCCSEFCKRGKKKKEHERKASSYKMSIVLLMSKQKNEHVSKTGVSKSGPRGPCSRVLIPTMSIFQPLFFAKCNCALHGHAPKAKHTSNHLFPLK